MSDTNGNLTYDMKHSEWLPEPQPKLDVKPELLPCPFCGEMPVIHYHNNYVEIYCDCDDCLMDEVKVERDGFDLHLDETEAISAWNTRASSRWIPVSEGLPEIGDEVIIIDLGRHRNVCYLEFISPAIGLKWVGDNVEIGLNNVIYWMPLPPPPEKL